MCRNYVAQWYFHLQWFVHNHFYDLILLIFNFASLNMADTALFVTIALTFIPCEAQRKVLALHTSQHMPLNAVQQLSFWMIFWNRNVLAQDHSLDAICYSHHKYQLVRSKMSDFSYHCIWNCHEHLKPSVSSHVNWQKINHMGGGTENVWGSSPLSLSNPVSEFL